MATIKTVTEITHQVATDLGTCAELVMGPDGQQLVRGGRGLTCDREAPRLAIDLRHLERRRVVACYCDRHGGEARARDELARDWLACAPPRVGDGDAVLDAGIRSLTSREVYVVVRPEKTRWLAWLSIGSHMLQVANPTGPKLNRNGNPRTKRGRNGVRRPVGAKAFASRDEALAAALPAWRANQQATVEAITAARGGTLLWGLPLAPRPDPILVEPGEHGNAWEAVTRGEVAP